MYEKRREDLDKGESYCLMSWFTLGQKIKHVQEKNQRKYKREQNKI